MSILVDTLRKIEDQQSYRAGKSTRTQKWTIRTTEVDEAFSSILSAPGVPQRYDVLDESRRVIVKQVDVRFKGAVAGGGAQFEISIFAETGDIISTTQSKDPCDNAPVVTAVPVAHQIVAEKAYKITVTDDGTVIESEKPVDAVNTAGDPYDPPLMTECYTTQFNIAYNVRSLRFSNLSKLYNTINEKSVTIGGTSFGAGTLMFRTLQPQSAVDDDGNDYWQVQVTLELDEELHFCQEIGNKGYRYKNDSGALVRAIGDDKTYVSTPIWLDKDGKKQDASAEKIYHKYRVPRKSNWPDVLNLPKTLRFN